MPKAKKLPSGSWRVQIYSHSNIYYDKDGNKKKQKVYKSFTSNDPSSRGKAEAELMAAEYQLRLNQDIKEQVNVDMTFGQALDKYIIKRSAVLSPKTVREYKMSRQRDMKRLMDMKLCDITQDDIQETINEERLNHSPKTVRNMHGLISSVFKTYRPDFALRTTLPPKVRPKIYVPTDEEVTTLMKYVEGTELEIPVLLAAFGPMRRSEICALEYSDIRNNTIHICKAMVMDENKNWTIKAPKSFSGDRYIDFPDSIIKKIISQKSSTGRIVNINPAQVSNRFRAARKRAGVNHFRFHDLRHYNASIAHALGMPDQYIMERGGWGSDAVLKSVYRHVMDDKKSEFNNRMFDHFEKVSHEISHEKK